jgi:hypothetical protein
VTKQQQISIEKQSWVESDNVATRNFQINERYEEKIPAIISREKVAARLRFHIGIAD